MKVIIAGGRNVKGDINLIDDVVNSSKFKITELVNGMCKTGVDKFALDWAKILEIPVKEFKPNWKFGKAAGPIRNKEMAEYGDALILIWDGESKGSKSMKDLAKKNGLKIYEFIVKE